MQTRGIYEDMQTDARQINITKHLDGGRHSEVSAFTDVFVSVMRNDQSDLSIRSIKNSIYRGKSFQTK